MEILFRNQKLKRIGNTLKEAQKLLGDKGGRLLIQRLDEMRDADNLWVLTQLPRPRCHQLTGDRQGLWAVDLDHPRRLIFEPANNPLPLNDDDSLDIGKVTAVLIKEIEDYHGKKRKQ